VKELLVNIGLGLYVAGLVGLVEILAGVVGKGVPRRRIKLAAAVMLVFVGGLFMSKALT